jgi:hypothetical protein
MTTQEYLVCQIRTLRPLVRYMLELNRVCVDAKNRFEREDFAYPYYAGQMVAFDSAYLTAKKHLTTAQELLRRMHGVRSGRFV